MSNMNPEDIWSAVGKPMTGIGAGRYRLTREYLHAEVGALRTDAQQIPTRFIVDVDMRQSMVQKGRGVGTVVVHVTRNDGIADAVELVDIPDPRRAVEVINGAAREARLEWERQQRTTHLDHQGGPGMVPPTAPPQAPQQQAAGPQGGGPLGALREMASLHDRGVLGDEQFIAEVKRLLG